MDLELRKEIGEKVTEAMVLKRLTQGEKRKISRPNLE